MKKKEPIKLEKNQEGLSVSSWGRKVVFNDDALPRRIISQGKEILAAPIRIVGVANEKEIVWRDSSNLYLADVEDKVIINGYSISDVLILNTSFVFDETGTFSFDVKISPMGVTENQVFGVEERGDPTRTIQHLYLEFPIKKDLNLYKLHRFYNNKVFDMEGNPLFESGKVGEKGVRSGFEALSGLSDGEVGLTVACESQKNWFLNDENDAIEIEETSDAYVLRYKLINRNPKSWNDDSLIWSPQLCYRFFLTPTPTKESNKDFLEDKIVHLGCFEHIKNEQDYYSFLEDPYNENESNFDHIVNSGAKTLILHERWNSIQTYWHQDQYTMDSLKKLVDKCHDKGLKIMVYFGFEITSIAHDFLDYQEDCTNYPREGIMYCDWYREPYQRATPYCARSIVVNEFINGLFKTVDRYQLDGVYLDGTATPRPCCNTNHGCGVRDEDGKLHPTYPIVAVTELIKTICEGIHKRGGRVDIHSSGLVCPNITHYVDSIWEGENLQTVIRDTDDRMFILDTIRSINTGPNPQFIAFNLRKDWGIKQAQAYCLPCGVYTRPNSIYQPLDVCKPIWDMISEFGISKANFVGYWENEAFKATSDQIVISYYEKEVEGVKKYLVYVSNPTTKPATFSIKKSVGGDMSFYNGRPIKDGEQITVGPAEIKFFVC